MREAELERTIADLGAALVVSRQKETHAINCSVEESENDSDDSGISELKEKLTSVEDEMEILKAQLTLERQRSETLQTEYEEVSQERINEASLSLARQKQYDRKVADLTLQVSQLQSSLHHSQQEGIYSDSQQRKDITNSNAITTEKQLQMQITSLSEELIKQRKKLEISSAEVLTLQNRLRAALTRAENAENLAAPSLNDDANNDIEGGRRQYYNGGKMRKRVGRRTKVATNSIRSIIKVHSGRRGSNSASERVCDFVDLVDNWALDTGLYFGSNPFARAFFLFYLIILHIWAFCLVLVHAHWSLEPPGDVGPAQLMKHSYRHMDQIQGGSNNP